MMIQNHVDKDNKIARVHQKITHDFVLDVYEQCLHEDDAEKREARIETARVLSQSIGDYLIDENEQTKKP